MVRLAVDFEFLSRTWWESGGQELWDAITEDFEHTAVVVDDDLAASWLTEAQAIPGWHDGPDYAPNPITLTPVESDEPFF